MLVLSIFTILKRIASSERISFFFYFPFYFYRSQSLCFRVVVCNIPYIEYCDHYPVNFLKKKEKLFLQKAYCQTPILVYSFFYKILFSIQYACQFAHANRNYWPLQANVDGVNNMNVI